MTPSKDSADFHDRLSGRGPSARPWQAALRLWVGVRILLSILCDGLICTDLTPTKSGQWDVVGVRTYIHRRLLNMGSASTMAQR